jgi:predicted metal-dependent peptidase
MANILIEHILREGKKEKKKSKWNAQNPNIIQRAIKIGRNIEVKTQTKR